MDGEATAASDSTWARAASASSTSARIRSAVVYERASRAPLPVFNEKVLCGLARGLDAPPAQSRRLEMAWPHRPLTTLAHT